VAWSAQPADLAFFIQPLSLTGLRRRRISPLIVHVSTTTQSEREIRMFIVTITDATSETSARTYARKADAIRGAQRAQRRIPDAQIAVLNAQHEHVWGDLPKPADDPIAAPEEHTDCSDCSLDETTTASTPEPDVEAPAKPKRRPRIGDPNRVTVKPDIKAARPFAIESLVDGDFVLDVTTTRKDGEPRVLLVTLSNPNESGHPCFQHTGDTATPGGLIRGLDGYWQPVIYTNRAGTGDVRAVGKRAGNKENAVRALITLWAETFGPRS
jgi:hypothetical protein